MAHDFDRPYYLHRAEETIAGKEKVLWGAIFKRILHAQGVPNPDSVVFALGTDDL